MAAKWAVAVVLLAVFVGYQLQRPANENLPSWPQFHIGMFLERWVPWLYQVITPPSLWLTRAMSSFATSKALYIACELGLPDLLSEGPLSSEEIAKRLGTDPDRTERIMKYLAVQSVFQRTDPRIYANTAVSEYLRKDHPESQLAYCIHLGFECTMMVNMYLQALYNSSLVPFSAAFNTHLAVWEVMEDPANAKMKANFDRTMVSLSVATVPPIVHDFPWARYANATVVDVGGGKGHVAAAVLRANPGFKAVVFDLDKGIEGAKVFLPEEYPDVYSRMSLVKGSFFESVPTGGDFYILKYILHDWSDENSIKILQTVSKALKATQQATSKSPSVLVVEHLYDYPPVHSHIAFMDMVMLGISGRERTLEEFEALLRKAGLRLVAVHSTRSIMTILEAKLA